MLSRLHIPDYDPRAIYAARRHVTIEGRTFKQGDPVPRSLAPSPAKYREWWHVGMLRREPYQGDLPANFDAASPPPASNGHAVSEAQKAANGAALQQALANGGRIDVANGHAADGSAAIPAGMVAAMAAPSPGDPNEGYIVAKGRGWCTVVFRDIQEKVRGLIAATERLNEHRVAAGLEPFALPEVDAAGGVPQEERPDVGEKPPMPGHVAQLQPGDEVVDGETGEITTVQPEPPVDDDPLTAPWGEEPDDDTPSVPYGAPYEISRG